MCAWPPQLRLDPDGVFRVHQALGFALWQVQQFEEVLAVFLSISFELEPGVGEERAQAVLSGFARKTLGQLLRDLEKYETVDVPLRNQLRHLLEERNWLVHRSRRLHHTDLYDADKLERLCHRLEQLRDLSLQLTKEFARIIEERVVEAGVDRKQIEAGALAELKRWNAI